MKVLVTGGTGVIGNAVVPTLLQAGHQVRLLSRHAENDARSFPSGVEAVDADLGEPSGLPDAIEGCSCVLHVAGIVEEEPPELTFQKINVDGTRRLLEAAQMSGMPRFIFISSLGAERGASDYQRSKYQAENLVRDYPGKWLILRLGNVYGPGDETISMLLKMQRSLPAVPVIARGDQAFQPVWFADVGRALTRAIDRPEDSGQVFELAGIEITTTDDILRRLAKVTGIERPRLEVPVWLTEVGVHALEALGAVGKKLLRRAGLDMPLSPATLTMLLEHNVLSDPARNALTVTYGINPTPLEEGLRILADLLPEQLPGEGVGKLQAAIYSAEIHGSPLSATALLDFVCDRIRDMMPIEFAAEPGAPESAVPGETLTAQIDGRGHVQVRLEERTPNCATFLTLEGHPLAGVMQLTTEDLPQGIRFSVQIASQAANVFDWIGLRAIGAKMQASNWHQMVRNVVKASGGEAPSGVQHAARTMSEEETLEIRKFAELLAQLQRKSRREAGELV